MDSRSPAGAGSWSTTARKWAKTDLPQSLDEVVDPRWAGNVGVAPTNGSFLSFVAAMILSEGEEATAAWLEKLAANDPVTYPDNNSIVAAVESGEIALGLVNHYYLLRLDAEQGGTVAKNEFLDDASAGSLVMPSGAGVLASSDQSAEATQLVEFLLSEEAQSYLAEETYEYPMIDGVEADPALPSSTNCTLPTSTCPSWRRCSTGRPTW